MPAEALRLLQRHESVCRGPCDVNKIVTKAQTFRYRSSGSKRNQNVLMCSRTQSGTFLHIYSKNFGTKPKLFDVFQLFFSKSKTYIFIPKILEQNQNFLMCSNFFLAKAKRYYLIQKLRNKTKTFWFSSQISKTKTERFEDWKKIWKLKKLISFEPKILKSERKRFGSIMNFLSKTNIFDFFGDVNRKTKANDLEKTLVWHY